MRKTAIRLGVISLLTFLGWSVPVYADSASASKARSAEPPPKDSAALQPHDLQTTDPDSSYRGANSKSEGEKLAEEHRLLKGQPLNGGKMHKTPQQLSTTPHRAAAQPSGNPYSSRVPTTSQLHQVPLPQNGSRPRVVSMIMGTGSQPRASVPAFNPSVPAPAYIRRHSTTASIGGPPSANARTTAALNGTQSLRKP